MDYRLYGLNRFYMDYHMDCIDYMDYGLSGLDGQMWRNKWIIHLIVRLNILSYDQSNKYTILAIIHIMISITILNETLNNKTTITIQRTQLLHE